MAPVESSAAPLPTGEGAGSWGRRRAPPIEPLCDGIWVAAREQRFWRIETGTRMTVIRLSDGGLFVHCPVLLDEPTRAAVDALGPVRAIVAPSLYHHLYVGGWIDAYPEASAWACPGLVDKRPDLAWAGTLEEAPLSLWAADLDQAPFTARFEREVVFLHQRTRTFVCADALLNLRNHPSRMTRAVALLMRNDAPGKGVLERFAVRDKKLGRRQVERILEWDFDRVVLAHGDLLPSGGKDAFRDAYAWLRR